MLEIRQNNRTNGVMGVRMGKRVSNPIHYHDLVGKVRSGFNESLNERKWDRK